MKPVNEDLIKQRAYEIWEKGGRPHGRDKEHWDQAAHELMNGAAGPKKARTAAKPTAKLTAAAAATAAKSPAKSSKK